jgi:hypothetical protein
MSTWIATKRHVKNTHLNEVREVGQFLKIDFADTEMKGSREK